MRAMPKRTEAEQAIAAAKAECLQTDAALGESIREFFVDPKVNIPKNMHYKSYLAENDWFSLSAPGYAEDRVLAGSYHACFGL